MMTVLELYRAAKGEINAFNGTPSDAYIELARKAGTQGADPVEVFYYGICLLKGYGCRADSYKALAAFKQILHCETSVYYYWAAFASNCVHEKAIYFYKSAVCQKKGAGEEEAKQSAFAGLDQLRSKYYVIDDAFYAVQELYDICLAYGYGCRADEKAKHMLSRERLSTGTLRLVLEALVDGKEKDSPGPLVDRYLLKLAKQADDSDQRFAFQQLEHRSRTKETVSVENLFAYGQCLLNGWGCAVDKGKAAETFKNLAERRHYQALCEYLKITELDGAALQQFLKSVTTEQMPTALFTLANIYQKQGRQPEAHCYFYLTAKTKTTEVKKGGKKTLSELSYEVLNSFFEKNKLLVTTCQILGYGTPAIAIPSDIVLIELKQNLIKDVSLVSTMALYDLGCYLISKNQLEVGKGFLQAAIAKGHPLALEEFDKKGYFNSFSSQGGAFQKQHFQSEVELLIEYSFALQAHCVSDKLWNKEILLKALQMLEKVNEAFEKHGLFAGLPRQIHSDFDMQKIRASEVLKKLNQVRPPEKLLEWQGQLGLFLEQGKLLDAKQFLSEKPTELKTFYAEKLCDLGEKKADLTYIEAAIEVGKLDALLLGAKIAGNQQNIEKELAYIQALAGKLASQANEGMRPDEPRIKGLLPLWQAMLSHLVDRIGVLAGAVTRNLQALRENLIKVFAQAVQPFCVLTTSHSQSQSLVKQYSEQLKRISQERDCPPEVEKAIKLLSELKILGGKSFFAKPKEIITSYYQRQAQDGDIDGLIASIKVIKPSFAEEDELSQQVIKVLNTDESNKVNVEKLLDVISPKQLLALKALYSGKHAQIFQYIDAVKFEQYKETSRKSTYTFAPHISKEADYLAQDLLERLRNYPEDKTRQLIACLSEEKKANLAAKYKDDEKYASVFERIKILSASAEVATPEPTAAEGAAAAPVNEEPSQTAATQQSRSNDRQGSVYGQPVGLVGNRLYPSSVFLPHTASAPPIDQEIISSVGQEATRLQEEATDVLVAVRGKGLSPD